MAEEQFDIPAKPPKVHDNLAMSDSYYWFNGNKEPLQKMTEYSFVITEEDAAENLNAIVTRSGLSPQSMDYKRYSVPKKAFCLSNESRTVWSKIPTRILSENETDILYSAPYYRTAEGFEVGLTNYFMVKLKKSSDLDNLKQFAEDHSAIVLYGDEVSLWYTLTCTSASEMNALELANKAYESGRFASADVEFVDDIQFVSSPSYNDTHYSTQWNLTGDYGINLGATHSITTGSDDITVAVIDNGFILNHPDMPIDAAISWDANSQTSPARQYYYNGNSVNNHGIGVAGVIGAVPNNGKGIAGIAPGVNLMAISARIEMHDSTDLTALNALKEAIDHANENGADVINNSWITKIKHKVLDDSIDDALTFGRNGKGCVVVFASGNDGTNVSKMPYRDNAGVICVGATITDGFRWSGSNYSEHLDIVAPGSYIPTLGEAPEYRNPDGTSYAAPHVSAIAGLMLSVNPLLTSAQVSEILDRTATKLPDYSFSTTKSHGTWDEEVGYGLVNCYAAVKLAQNYFNTDSYLDLIEFDYSGTSISLTLDASKDIMIIWDENDSNYSFIPAGSSTTLNHTYSTSGIKHVTIAECLSGISSPLFSSAALTRFDLTTGSGARNIEIYSLNKALEYVRIIGGSSVVSQTITIEGLPALKDLYLVRMPDVQVVVDNCPSLQNFGSSRYIWGAPTLDIVVPIRPLPIVGDDALDPNIVGGGTTLAWPDIPESVPSFKSLRITDCEYLTNVSLENVGIGQFDFSDFPRLQYLYVSSHNDKIVGGTGNTLVLTSKGEFLANTIATLPAKGSLFKGKVLVRGVNQSNTEYVEAVVAAKYQTQITTFEDNNNWDVVWDSGVTDKW